MGGRCHTRCFKTSFTGKNWPFIDPKVAANIAELSIDLLERQSDLIMRICTMTCVEVNDISTELCCWDVAFFRDDLLSG